MEEQYHDGKYTRCNDNKCSKPELELIDEIVKRMKLNENQYNSSKNNTFYTRIKDYDRTISLDFVFNKKVIEFNGDYWHCNPLYYKENYYHKHIKNTAKEIWNNNKNKLDYMKKLGYDVLEIWETDYNNNKEKIIQECINFLTN